MSGLEHPQTKLWMLPLSTNTDNIYVKEKYQPVAPPQSQLWANMISPPPALTTKADLVQYYHHCAFVPRNSTWMQAIENGNYATWPGLMAYAVQKYLPDSVASDKGHIKREQKNYGQHNEPSRIKMMRSLHKNTFLREQLTLCVPYTTNHSYRMQTKQISQVASRVGH